MFFDPLPQGYPADTQATGQFGLIAPGLFQLVDEPLSFRINRRNRCCFKAGRR